MGDEAGNEAGDDVLEQADGAAEPPSSSPGSGSKPNPKAGTKPKGLRRLAVAFVIVLGLGLVVAGGGYIWFTSEIERPGPLAADRTVVITPGSSVAGIAGELEAAGIIRSVPLFRAAARFQEQGPLRAGEFQIGARASVRGVLTVLRTAKPVVRRLTVPEGLSETDVLALVDASEGLTGPLPRPIGEGTLLPETYHYTYFDSKTEVVRRMRRAMTDAITSLWGERAADLPISSPEEAVVLASIVEKETGVVAERPRVAGVFINRLRRGMRLQSDPTVIYGLTGGEVLGRGLTKAELKEPTPYNTYVIKGLPPGPIANPGRAAIAAVLNPAKTKDLYFVADGTGGHAFARTLDEHNRNVAKWRRIERQRKKEALSPK